MASVRDLFQSTKRRIDDFLTRSNQNQPRPEPQTPKQEDYYAGNQAQLYVKQTETPQAAPYSDAGYSYQQQMQQPQQPQPQQQPGTQYTYTQDAFGGVQVNAYSGTQPSQPYAEVQQQSGYAPQGRQQPIPQSAPAQPAARPQENVSYFPGAQQAGAQASMGLQVIQLYSYRDFHVAVSAMAQGSIVIINCETMTNRAEVGRSVDLIFGAAFAYGFRMQQLSSWKNGIAPVYLASPGHVTLTLDAATEQLTTRGADPQRRPRQAPSYGGGYASTTYRQQRPSYEAEYEEEQTYEEPEQRYRRPTYRASPD